MKYKYPVIDGLEVDGRAFPTYVWNADLIYFDGPFLSLFGKEGAGDALFFWLDTNGRSHRWGVVDIDRAQLSGYLNSNISLREIIKSVTTIYLFESTATGRRNRIKKIDPKNLPLSYWPKEGSFLTENIASDAAIALREETSRRYELQFTGEEIFVEDLSRIPRLYEQLYSFIYGLSHLDRQAVRERIINATRQWTGGFAAVHLFSGLKSVTPTIHRARVSDMYMASPGEIGMQLLPEIAKKIAESVEALGQNSAIAELTYRDCYAYFRNQGLGGFEDSEERRGDTLTDSQKFDIDIFLTDFFNHLGLQAIAPAFKSLEVDALGQLRALLAYYRRLRKLRDYVDRGLLKIPKKSVGHPPSRSILSS